MSEKPILDRVTLDWIAAQLRHLAAEAHTIPSKTFDPNSPNPAATAYYSGKARGIEDALAYVERQTNQLGQQR